MATPALDKHRLVWTYAKKVRSEARWSRATLPPFWSVIEGLVMRSLRSRMEEKRTKKWVLELWEEDSEEETSLLAEFEVRKLLWVSGLGGDSSDDESAVEGEGSPFVILTLSRLRLLLDKEYGHPKLRLVVAVVIP